MGQKFKTTDTRISVVCCLFDTNTHDVTSVSRESQTGRAIRMYVVRVVFCSPHALLPVPNDQELDRTSNLCGICPRNASLRLLSSVNALLQHRLYKRAEQAFGFAVLTESDQTQLS